MTRQPDDRDDEFASRQECIASCFEPNAQDPSVGSLTEGATISIAISLKRIADAIVGDDRNSGIHRLIWELTQYRPTS